MGNHNSTPDDDRAAIEQHVRRQRQYDLLTSGILVPPLFGIPSDTRVNPSIILNTLGNTSLETPTGASPILLGYVDYLRTQSDLSYRLLHAHLQPGLSITSFTSKNSLRVGIFDYSTANRMNSIPNSPIASPLERSGTVSPDGSDDDDSTLRLPQSNSSKSMFGGQLTFERQFRDPQGRNYGSIHCHTDPTNPQLPYTVQLIHRPVPSLSLFGVVTSSLSLSSPSSSVLPSTNGYIGAQLSHMIPLSPNPSRNYDTSAQQYEDTTDTAYDSSTAGTSYVAQTTYDDDTNLHCNLGIYIPIHWDNVIQNLDSVIPKSQKNSHLIPFYYDRKTSTNSNSNSQNKQPQSWASQFISSINEVNGCASVSLLGATAAVQGSIPLLPMTNASDGTFSSNRIDNNKYCCKTSSYFSTNINDEATNRSPIQLTIHQQNQFGPTTTSIIRTISASQIITFQRYHFNIVDEYRAPYVHNTLAWTIQMESLSSSESTSSFATFSSAEDSSEHNNMKDGILKNRMNRVSLGLAWQLNRNVGVKAVWYPQQSSSYFNEHSQSPSSDGMTATTAILFKRWYHPRITCSILHKWSFYDPTKNRIVATSQFAGIGIDIETGDEYYSSSSSNATNRSKSSDDYDNNMGSPKQHPPTIAVLPKELYKLKQQHRMARRPSGIPVRLHLNTSDCVHPAERCGKPSVYA